MVRRYPDTGVIRLLLLLLLLRFPPIIVYCALN
jgi:hypothetical protein